MKYKAGQTLICTYAASNAYTVGKEYNVFDHPKEGLSVRGNDKLHDSLALVISKFKLKEEPKEVKDVRPILDKQES